MAKHPINPEPDGESAPKALFQKNADWVCRLSPGGDGNFRVKFGPNVLGAQPTVTATLSPEGFDGKPPSVGGLWTATAEGPNVKGASFVFVNAVSGQCTVVPKNLASGVKQAPISYDRPGPIVSVPEI